MSTLPGKAAEGSAPKKENNTANIISEKELKHRSMAMLARFMKYAKSIYTDAGVNARGDSCGYFKALNAGGSDEDGVRTNADIAMTMAFVARYGKAEGMDLPAQLTYYDLQRMAKHALTWAYSTHRANQLVVCADGKHWGSQGGQWQWESSLWAMSVALCAHFLNAEGPMAESVRKLIEAEADAELVRQVPTNYRNDTKAEENGWDANVLACAVGMMPNHPHSRQWREAMCRFGFNCYTVKADQQDTTMVAGRHAKDWYAGANLFDDFTLQNHNFFHTSYQNVVMQEQAESMVVEKLFGGEPTTDIFTWHWQEVWNEVLAPMALCDGELAMPNGNDWSLYLGDQMPAYTAMAAFKRNGEALMLESRTLRLIEARQATTPNGAWMLHADIGPRRMGVTAHRVMMTWLMHELFSTADLTPVGWETFQYNHAKAKILPAQNIIRSLTEERFVSFSWSNGLKNANCLIVPNQADERARIIVPYRKGGTGNLIGYYGNEPSEPSGELKLAGNTLQWIASGRMLIGAGKAHQNFGIAALPSNAVVMVDELKASSAATLGTDRVGMLAISVDPVSKPQRTLYWDGGSTTTDGSEMVIMPSRWVNIDNQIGIISLDERPIMAFGDRELCNSIYTAKLYPSYGESRVSTHENDNRHHLIYYMNVTAEQTARLARKASVKTSPGKSTMHVEDTDGNKYQVEANLSDPDKRIVTKKL